MGVVCQMITVHHESWVATLEISFPETWQKKSDFYQLVKNNFWGVCQNYYNFTWGGYREMITVLHRGGYAQMITILHGGGYLGTPESDYVICARPLITMMKVMIIIQGGRLGVACHHVAIWEPAVSKAKPARDLENTNVHGSVCRKYRDQCAGSVNV